MKRSSMLQRALKFGAQEITSLHEDVEFCKRDLSYWGNFEGFGCEFIQEDRKCIKSARKRIKQLAELQVFLKRELQQAYVIEQIEDRWNSAKEVGNECVGDGAYFADLHLPNSKLFKHSPQFMSEAPPAELGSFVQDEA